MLRPGINYGPHFQEGFGNLLKQMQRGSAAVIGSGNNKVPLVYEDDVAKAFLKTLQLLKAGNKKNKEIIHNAFNVAGDHPTQLEAYRALADIFGLQVPKRHVPVKFAVAIASAVSLYCDLVGKKKSFPPEYVELLARHRVYNTAKAKKMLRFTASTPLVKGMQEVRKTWKV